MRYLALACRLGALVICSLSAATVNADSWQPGIEREVDEGWYFTLLTVQSGWRLWRIEFKNEIECRAVKSAIGLPHPSPAGASVNFTGGEPFIVVFWRSDLGRVETFWEGPNFENSGVQLRSIGDKFWHDEVRGLTAYDDGDKVEVNIISWKYPKIRAGYNESRVIVDLSGINKMRNEVERGYRNK